MRHPCMLVVESDDDERRRISAWLDDAGYHEVLMCPGPSEPDYTCVGSRCGVCPLSNAADVVIVDLRQRSDEALTGTAGWELMLFYYDQGKQIVAITDAETSVLAREDDQLVRVQRPLDRERFLGAVRAAVA